MGNTNRVVVDEVGLPLVRVGLLPVVRQRAQRVGARRGRRCRGGIPAAVSSAGRCREAVDAAAAAAVDAVHGRQAVVLQQVLLGRRRGRVAVRGRRGLLVEVRL